MKIAALATGACLALAVSGPAVLNTERAPRAAGDIVAPAWMELPSKPFISSVEYSGEAGTEAAYGTIVYDLPSDGASEVNWLRNHLKAAGYAIDDRTTGLDTFVSVNTVISARDAVTGRRVNIVNVIRLDGATLRVSFEDPTAGTYVSML